MKHLGMNRKRFWTAALAMLLLFALVPAVGAEPSVWYTSIFVSKNPTKMSYYVGESFDPSGIVVRGYVEHSDGTVTINTLGENLLSYSPKTFTSAGTKTVTVTARIVGKSGAYQDFSTTLQVTVKPSIEPIVETPDSEKGDAPAAWTNSISVKKNPSRTNYLIGESFDPADMVIVANQTTPSGNAKETVSKSYLSYSPKSFSKAGKQKVTVSAKLTDSEGKEKKFMTTVSVVVYEEIKITKHPTKETVQEGEGCLFIARADNSESCRWFFEKDGERVDAKQAESHFKGLKLSGASSEKLKLTKIPASLDGWKVTCRFSTPVEEVYSNKASLTVKSANSTVTVAPATAAPATEAHETPAPTAEPVVTTAPVVTEAPIAVDQPTEKPADQHRHVFGETYLSDNVEHWRECSCGERTSVEKHIVAEWRTLSNPTQTQDGVEIGTCLVCGRMVERSVPYSAPDLKILLLGIIGAFVLVTVPPLVIIAIVLASKNRKKKQRELQ